MNTPSSLNIAHRFRPRLERLYPDEISLSLERLEMILGRYGLAGSAPSESPRWSERDVALITYGDSIRSEVQSPLATLREFAERRLSGSFSIVHILPFYPWSSDDGFAVKDYREVDKELGSWEEVEELGKRFDLMFDWVLNHVSSKSSWFRSFRNCILPYRDYFIGQPPDADLSAVVRPRTSPLLTPVSTRSGRKHVWTTFGPDQIDLDWSNPDVFFEMLDVLLTYIARKARIVRLDAVAFLWKRPGTSCLHLEETHEVVRLVREILEVVAPHVLLLTETNVPHQENLSYLGEGDEAHMIYQFALPPLLLHGLLRGDAGTLGRWASSLPPLPPGTTYFNFTASHDGIGVRPLEGILDPEEIELLSREMEKRGGRLSWRSQPDGSRSLYEINIAWYSALCPEQDREGEDRYLCSLLVQLALQGIPALYIHSLLATPNDHDGVEESGMARRINRRKWDHGELEELLEDPSTHHHRIFHRLVGIVQRRVQCEAFHPEGEQEILELDSRVLSLIRRSPSSPAEAFCLFNFSREKVELDIAPWIASEQPHELVANTTWSRPEGPIAMEPYGALWLLSSSRD